MRLTLLNAGLTKSLAVDVRFLIVQARQRVLAEADEERRARRAEATVAVAAAGGDAAAVAAAEEDIVRTLDSTAFFKPWYVDGL